MPRLNKKNIDRKTNKPSLDIVESIRGDRVLDRSMQTRRDDDVIRSPKRTLYDVDYAIKWYVENEIQPQIKAQQTIISVPVIYANGEKWDNVQRLGYLRDEKGMLQSPLIMLKRSSVAERDSFKTLDVNWPQTGNQIVYRQRYNEKNRYEDELFPIPLQQPQSSQQVMIVDIPKYVTVEYEMLVWCDFTTQLNELVDQIFTYSRFAWGNESNKFATTPVFWLFFFGAENSQKLPYRWKFLSKQPNFHTHGRVFQNIAIYLFRSKFLPLLSNMSLLLIHWCKIP